MHYAKSAPEVERREGERGGGRERRRSDEEGKEKEGRFIPKSENKILASFPGHDLSSHAAWE